MEPFAADTHAADAPQLQDADDASATEVRALLAEHYPRLDASAPVEVIGAVSMNSRNFRVGGHYVKVIDAPAPRDDVALFPAMADALVRGGIPTTRFAENALGEPITVVAEPGGAAVRYLYAQPYLDAGFYTGAPGEFARALDLVVELGTVLQSVPPADGQREPYGSWRPGEVLDRISAAVAAQRDLGVDPGPAERQFEAARGQLTALAESYERRYPREDDRLVHSDLHPHNLLFRDGEIAAVLDLESFRVMPADLATAFAVYKLGRKSVASGRMTIGDVQCAVAARFGNVRFASAAGSEVMRRLLYHLERRIVAGDERWQGEIDKFAVGLGEVDRLLA